MKERKICVKTRNLRPCSLLHTPYSLLLTTYSLLFLLFFIPSLSAQQKEEQPLFGDPAIGRRYTEWAAKEMEAGRYKEALAGLERGADYAASYSDLSFLLGYARDLAGKPRYDALAAYAQALETKRWEKYRPSDCRLKIAGVLVALRRYDDALQTLDINAEERVTAGEKSDALKLRLAALKGLRQNGAFIRLMGEAMDQYPRDGQFVKQLFAFARFDERRQSRELVDLAVKRLPALTADYPELAYLAVPYIRDTGLARRYVEEYRANARNGPTARAAAASLPAALSLGIISDDQAVNELFAGRENRELDVEVIRDVYANLRGGEAREKMRRNLLSFSGVIIEDDDVDGYRDSQTFYANGLITRYEYDADQDRLAEWDIRFNAGVPADADAALGGYAAAGEEGFAAVTWERYPAVLHTDVDGSRFIPRPLDFFWKPVSFPELRTAGGAIADFLYPAREDPATVLTRRSIASFAVVIERPSADFPGGIVREELINGVVKGAKTFAGGKLAAETEYVNGRPVLERLDLDNDGRMETVRRYSRAGIPESRESDWDGDGIYEYAETYTPDGVIKSWDLDKDGIRETER